MSSSFVARPQPPPVSVLFNVSVDPVACMCCFYVLHPPSLNYFLFASQSSCRSCCLLVMLFLSPRPSLHCLLSLPLSSPSVLLLACVTCPQLPPVCLPCAVAAAFLFVGPVAFMYCPSPATARLSWKSCVNRLSRWRWPGQVAAKTQTNLGIGDKKDCTKPIGGQARKRSLLGVGGR